MKNSPSKTPNSGSQVPLSLHPNFPTHLLRKTSDVPRPVELLLSRQSAGRLKDHEEE